MRLNKSRKQILERNLAALSRDASKRPRISAFDVTQEQYELIKLGFQIWGEQGIGKFITFCVLDWVKRNAK